MIPIYHVYNRSIAGFKIFNNEEEFMRMIYAIRYYREKNTNAQISLSMAIKNNSIAKESSAANCKNEKIVDIIAYCIMPTHIHLILSARKDGGMAIFLGNVLNSYTRYFNTKHKRKGPLWEGRSKKVLIETDEQLLHLTRYIHLNPVTAYLVNKPEAWTYSSYGEYLKKESVCKICVYNDILDINPNIYRQFVEYGIDYQRKLEMAKKSRITS